MTRTKTRKVVAEKLLERLTSGPAFSDYPTLPAFTPEEAARQYKIWAESWILEDLILLVPELRPIKK